MFAFGNGGGKIATNRHRTIVNWFRNRANDYGRALERADAMPSDARAQAEAMAVLIDSRPVEAIKRFESGRFARNKECTELYIEALVRSNQTNKLTDLVDRATTVNTGDETPKANRQPLSTDGSSKDRPLYIHTVNAQSGESRFWRAVGGIINLVISAALLFAVYKSVPGRLEDIFGKTVHKLYEKPGEKAPSFKDVRGCDEAKEELQEIVEFLKNPEKFTKLGARLPKGVLLVGPPGTGKTLLARAVAGEANVPFIFASGAEFDEMFVGMGSMRIRQMFEAAKRQAPCIIFIDEIDAIGSKRNPRDPQHARMSLNQLLVELDGFTGTEGVVVVAATNFPETLDKALLRPGRFDRHVTVPLPDVKGRRDILDLYLGGSGRVAKDVDVSVLARGTPGFSGADLNKLVNQAKISASKENSPFLTMRHLEAAKDEMVMGQERRSAVMAVEDRQLTAYHEGGHAVVAMFTPGAMPIHKATIVPRGRALGMVAQLPERDHPTLTRQQLLARLDVAMGGRLAEEIVFGADRVTTGAQSDFDSATRIARAMVTQFGMSDAVGFVVIDDNDDPGRLAPETRALIDGEVRRLLDESRVRAGRLLRDHRPFLDRLAAALLDRETLTREDIDRLAQ